jgi:hypothetical protein
VWEIDKEEREAGFKKQGHDMWRKRGDRERRKVREGGFKRHGVNKTYGERGEIKRGERG